MPIWERFHEKQKMFKEESGPLEEVVLVPEFSSDPELDDLVARIEELSRYKVAAYMEGEGAFKDEIAALQAEIDPLIKEKGDVLDSYLAPYFKIVLDLNASEKQKPFPMSNVEEKRFLAAQSLLIEKGLLK